MAHLAKLETRVDIKSSPEKVYGIFRNQMSRLVQMFPQNIKNYEVVGGGELKTGSITRWRYALPGMPEMTARIKIEAIDDARKSITFNVMEGDVLKLYKSFKAKVEAGGGFVKWTVQVEKANSSSPPPDAYINFADTISRSLDTYFLRT